MQRLLTHLSLVLILLTGLGGTADAQASDPSEAINARVSRAKALIAMRNHVGAIFELEGIRRETDDQTVHSVANVLLMQCYLEQGDYKRAENFLLGFYDGVKSRKSKSPAHYYAVAGQVVKGARSQTERYRVFGLTVSDKNIPAEASAELDKMRSILETVSEQATTLSLEPSQSSAAFSLLEEATTARSALARDEYDSNRWKEELADARELLAQSRSVILDAVDDGSPLGTETAATRTVVIPTVSQQSGPAEKAALEVVKADEPSPSQPTPSKPVRQRRVGGVSGAPSPVVSAVSFGSLLDYAVQKAQPVYPASARNLRVTGAVRVEMIIDEAGNVSEVVKVAGPLQLQNAAREAAMKWKFKPLMRDGVPARMNGFITFNFSL